ncbi:hypothetical protein RCH06_003394, partial [Polaromonas sp. CG_9.5]|nr:hypothetical protein [Polaromonas sp. CG_9.5]
CTWPLMSLSFSFSLSELNHSARDTFSGGKVRQTLLDQNRQFNFRVLLNEGQ